ncbi:hybrid sensor histidine kinase/response regulator [Geminocystis sp. GBBB08]|uniref:hybrid sensor histidine kinase/response regulator n=1 Tax=Geminocystis sp. GBBB08 TaxID=2604140 RepID=UPI0027E29C40|nr:hybrid sensor histidine kinase/response regulator [Geminocystis sp. GBBB08]MBL1208821.1 hybrid sensor histidine kinase/response regulator [Geminocystis sp. GBBB08]
MDRETQIKFNFLEEAEGYLDQIESVLLTLNSNTNELFDLDITLRAAHSLKGSAGMMGFSHLSKTAHRLEDFLKILRVRFVSLSITPEVQTLLLKGIDSLRDIINFYQQGIVIDESFIENQINPIFESLRQYLGDLQQDDENNLFALNHGTGTELELFQEEVDRILDELSQQLNHLSGEELSQTLIITTEELMVFSQMANIEAFTQLCQSIQQQTLVTNIDDLPNLAQQALNTWRQSYNFALGGNSEQIPTELNIKSFDINTETTPTNWADISNFDLDLSQVQLQLTNLEEQFLEQPQGESITPNLTQDLNPLSPNIPVKKDKDEAVKMVRIPAKQLAQFNTLFGKLILERNSVNEQLEQLKNFAFLMRQRMLKLEESQEQLIKWYDRASIEGLINTVPETKTLTATINGSSNTLTKESQTEDFDILEMDRYTDLHLISQEQIETIVQLKEVSTDIQLGLLDINQTMGELTQTTTALQKNVTRTQMTPFADVVKRFPRMMRDLSVQFNKQVKLIIEGEGTLIDRVILDKLHSPLNHLLRNAFDHGIESPDIRISKGKPPEGKITISAVNRANQTIITIEDDGNGISLKKISDRLLNQSISPEDIKKMSENQILNYIFEPGFSTKEVVTELSGRGVGMDVVRTNLREMRGDVQVKTKEGKGTTFIINIPFSLSVLKVMLLERNGLVFAIPLNSIRELKSFTTAEIIAIEDQDQLQWNGKNIPVVRMEETFIFHRVHKSFPLKGNPLINKSTIVVVGESANLGGIYLDRVWGEQEVTVYPILSPIPLPRGFNNSIILGDGRVIPLIEPSEMLQGCLENSSSQSNFDHVFNILTPQEQIKSQVVISHRILIVDDSINVRNYLALTLEKAGYQVEEARDGREAVDKLFNGLSVKAVISDIEMPRLDGYGLLKEVKSQEKFKDLPIIMLTSRNNDKHRKLAFNLGANGYFSKPYNEQELLHKLNNLIDIPIPNHL